MMVTLRIFLYQWKKLKYKFRWITSFVTECSKDINYSYLLTELRPSWGATNCAATQELPSILWNSKFQYRVHKSPPLIPILSHINPIHTIPSYLAILLSLSSKMFLRIWEKIYSVINSVFYSKLYIKQQINLKQQGKELCHPFRKTCEKEMVEERLLTIHRLRTRGMFCWILFARGQKRRKF
jgi:hypothetical protein